MLYILDTSILIELLRDNDEAWTFIAEHPKDIFATSAICQAEVYEGIYRENPDRIVKKKEIFIKLLTTFDNIHPFTPEQAETAGKIRAGLSKSGHLIGDLDILIAACAISLDATLWTHNKSHFSKISGLNILPLTG